MSAPVIIDLQTTLPVTIGALLIGLFISCGLFGIGTVQTYLYYTHFPSDKIYLKTMVMTVWICELVHCVCICHSFYVVGVVGYGDPSLLYTLPRSFDASIALSGIIATIVQSFYVERVRIISGKVLIPILCWFLTVFRFILTLLATADAMNTPSLHFFETNWKWICASALATGSAVDLLIAILLSHYLRVLRHQNSSKGTSFLIDKITAWTIQTGLATSLAGLIMLICFLSMPQNFIWLGFFMFLARIFSNSLLASLNARTILRENRPLDISSRFQASPDLIQKPSYRIAVHVSKMTEVTTDPVFAYGVI